jgi:transcription elongation GreA/GreB family factor
MTMTPSKDDVLTAEMRRPIEQALDTMRRQRADLLTEIAAQEPVKDSADNADRIQLGDDLARLDDRITELVDRLRGGGTVQSGLIAGTTVVVRFPDGLETLRVVPLPVPSRADERTLSVDSPLSQALAGHQPGDTVTYRTPAGDSTVYLVDIQAPA